MKLRSLARPGALCAVLLLSLLLPSWIFAGAAPSLDEDLKTLARGDKLPLHIPDAKYRIATFPFEDPDGTGLGDALARIAARETLLGASGISIGVLAYQGGLAPGEPDGLSYFDKVEKVATAQDVVLSMWGMVRRSGASLRIDTYMQLPQKTIEKYLVWRVTLPRVMKGTLVAHLRPDRILVQTIELPGEAGIAFRDAAQRLVELHKEPSDSSAVVGVLPRHSVYYVVKQSGNWVFMNGGPHTNGWVLSNGYCVGAACEAFLDAGRFSASLLNFMAGSERSLSAGRLAPDAAVMSAQIANYSAMERSNGMDLVASDSYLRSVTDALQSAAAKSQVPAGGAALANARAIDRLVALLRQQANARRAQDHSGIQQAYDELVPDRAAIDSIAFELADASQLDPTNTDVLQNLAVLFAYAGDGERASLARALLTKLGGSMEFQGASFGTAGQIR